MSNLSHLLEIEETNDLWHPEINNLHLWSAIRTTVLSNALYLTFNHTKPHTKNISLKSLLNPAKWREYSAFLRFMIAPKRTDYSALILKDLNTKIDEQDRIYSAYYSILQKPLILETNFTNRQVKDAYTEDILRAWIIANSKRMIFSTSEKKKIHDFSSDVSHLFGIPHFKEELSQRIRRYIGSYQPFYNFTKSQLLTRLSSKIAIVHAASYSSHYALSTRILHDLGCKVIEVQHGTIHSEHFAYQMPKTFEMEDHPCHVYLPDVLLTFGDYWNQVAHVPYPCVTIGYPYLSQIVDKATQKFPKNTTRFLIVSQGIVTQKMVELTHRLSAQYPDENIIFKLHPSEVDFRDRYDSLTFLANVRVVGHGNVYDLIAQCEIIIGYSSTVLYEALAFPEKRIFFWDNDSVDAPIGTRFADEQELLTLLEDEHTGYTEIDPEKFWAKDWHQRLSTFFETQPL